MNDQPYNKITMKQSKDFEIDLNFDRGNMTYKPQQTVTGTIRLAHTSASTFKIDVASLVITPIGKMSIHNRQSNKKVELLSKEIQEVKFLDIPPIELAKNKTLNQSSVLSFRFKLNKGEHRYAETYVGVYITVTYEIEVSCKFVNNPIRIQEAIPFYIQVPKQGREAIDDFVYPKKKNFMLRSEDMKGDKIPKFKIRGEFDSQICFFAEDLNGSIVIDQAESPIRSIDLQMYRVEGITGSQTLKERTEIQMIQMCDGNVTRNMELPIYMILPRYYSCPSLRLLWCSLDFEVDLIIIFKDGFKVTANIPLKFIRS